jgi:4-amino-4-deoxy-L-arabinose transferase-like glycosyltransferase
MPDALHVFLGVLSLYLVSRWVQRHSLLFAILAGLTFSAAVLTKPYGLVLLLPIVYLLLKEWGVGSMRQTSVYVFVFLSLLPLALWRWHISHYPEGIFATQWLYNGGDIRFTGAYFRWIIFDRMNRLIFATGGFVLFWLGIIRGYEKREGLFYFSWLASIFVFFIIIARGNVTHDYYQLPLVPIGCIFIAKGVDFLLNFGNTFLQRSINSVVAVTLVLLMLAFGWYEVRGFFNINNPPIVMAGKTADQILPADAKVITPYQNDPAFLYQTNRHGWTVGGDRIPEFIRNGATHLISVNYDDETRYWMDRCEVVVERSEFVIVNVQECDPEIE